MHGLSFIINGFRANQGCQILAPIQDGTDCIKQLSGRSVF